MQFTPIPYFIAEIGVNHDGSFDKAIRLVESASKCGANAVKFQSFKASDVVIESAPKANYQLETTGKDETQKEMLQKLEINEEWYPELRKCCDKNKLHLISTPYTFFDAELIKRYKFDFIKLASVSAVEFPFISQLSALEMPIIFSTGMCSLDEIDELYYYSKNLIRNFAILHCTSSYPTKINDSNLSVLKLLIERYDCPVGFSDHTIDIRIAFAAAAMNCNIFERHFTLNKNDSGPDHRCSSDPKEFSEYIDSVRSGNLAMGSLSDKPALAEKSNIFSMRRCMRYSHDFPKGHVIKEEDICFKRPMEGLTGNNFLKFDGKVLKNKVLADQPLSWDHLSS